jgi:aspartate/methionine/tyrosine aminotransferase
MALNAVARAREALRARGVPVIDLTVSNPTEAGLAYAGDVLAPLADSRGRVYAPAPLGLASAREAVAEEVRRSEARSGLRPTTSDRVVLTASTSEAYAILFKLLCDAGEQVLVPQPSYPLFELLTRLEGVVSRTYRLEYHGAWSIDRTSVERALETHTRAILVVSPNNPTGSMLRAADRDWLAELAADRGVALISDEVFADYLLAPRPDASTLAGESRALTFVLGGLSKSAGLPQVKLAWIVASGPDTRVGEALHRLELICDTYLSVSTPVQIAAPSLIRTGFAIRQAIAARLTRNLAALRAAIANYPAVRLLEPEGGWSAVLRVPATVTEEALVLRLLNEAHVHVQPGYFFDFADEAFVVLSLLAPPDAFDAGVKRVVPIAAGSA